MSENEQMPAPAPKPRGRPFQKGQVVNPGGYPRIKREVVELAREYSVEALERAVELMRNPKTPAIVALKAAELVLNRGLGMPRQAIDTTLRTKMTWVDLIKKVEPMFGAAVLGIGPVAGTDSPASQNIPS